MFDNIPENAVDIKCNVEDAISVAIKQCEGTIKHIDRVIPEILEDSKNDSMKGDEKLRMDCIESLKKERESQIELSAELKIVASYFVDAITEWHSQKEKVF